MKKLLFPVITLALILLIVIPAMAIEIEPMVATFCTGPYEVEVGVEQSWFFFIDICPDEAEDLEDIVVQGGIGADLVITTVEYNENGNPITVPQISKKEEWTISLDGTELTLAKRGGKMGATIVTWTIGDLDTTDFCLSLKLTIQTGKNPKNKQEFTSVEEDHELDGGFSATYTYLGIEYETLETDPLTVDVVIPTP